jgi:tRNA G18 (ribose-2'-O)-methylase SpoU
MIDSIKDCLAEVYKEVHGSDIDNVPYKQMEELLIDAEQAINIEADTEEELVNFQRKIMPLDALDLSIKSMHEQKLFNAAGKKKQQLVVCATLVDKVPNLAGLARTSEIFAAQTLVIPNLLVKKQDDFKSISASANDWIDMEECKEEDLLKWLYKKKAEGFTIVGLEQTSSSKCITKTKFPEKTVLLLGKEKEGIPVQYLSAVDTCIEIPQLGIIRSLNVHVTGALAIWKYTEQMMRRTRR